MRLSPFRSAILGCLIALAACGQAPDPLIDELPSMGDFRLGHVVLVTDNMQQVPPSRQATAEEWTAILGAEIDRRFSLYEGERLYHLGIAIEGYALAPPGIPLLVNPRSVLVLSVNVWDDALGVKLNTAAEQILVLEGSSRETAFIGSGIARTRDEQMQVLARNAARQIQRWMRENPTWFAIDPEAPPFRAAQVATDAAIRVETLPPPVDGMAN
ncbi:hypothetical protein LSUCC0031_12550 [Rhodobacterales bacterium LSUCC0031]|nr:hypothetical protein [Rhodobacterales bacterium LSUCC0031]